MKIFLSSTSYDLYDIRALTIEYLKKRNHEILYYESPTFPARRGYHAHDQCILAVDDCEVVICIIDRRYGEKYGGNYPPNEQSITLKKDPIKIGPKDLSVTWCELIRAYDNGKSVITFVRNRTLDEKRTRRNNQGIKRFKPAYVECNEVFDFIDWIGQKKKDNWIVSFDSVIDYQTKLEAWITEIERTIIPVFARTEAPFVEKPEPRFVRPLTFIVEGETDRLIITRILQHLHLPMMSDVIPQHGKANILRNLKYFSQEYSASHAVFVVIDADTIDDREIESIEEQFLKNVGSIEHPVMQLLIVVPIIEAWLLAATHPEMFRQGKPLKHPRELKEYFMKESKKEIVKSIDILIENLDKASEVCGSLYAFINHVKDISKMIKT